MQPISLLIFSHLFSQHLMDIIFLYLHMGRPPQERHILWYVFSYSSHPAVHLHKIDLFTMFMSFSRKDLVMIVVYMLDLLRNSLIYPTQMQLQLPDIVFQFQSLSFIMNRLLSVHIIAQ